MSEAICLITFFLMCFVLMICVYAGRTAVFVFTVGCILISNITVSKQVEFFGLTTSLGIFIFSVTYLANDIVTECWGKNDGNKLVISNLCAQVAFMAYSMCAIWTPPAPTDSSSDAITKLFTVTPRITIAAIVAATGGFICVAIFSFLKRRYPEGWVALAVRNTISTSIGNSVNSVLFFVIAFYGIIDDSVLQQIIASAVIAKITVAFCDTPFMLLAREIKKRGEENKTSIGKQKSA